MFIEADNKTLGLVCFLGIGMTEVSTCDITVKEGQHVKKGDELGMSQQPWTDRQRYTWINLTLDLGMFHYGGSSHVCLFRKGVELEGFPETENVEHNVRVRSKLAVVVTQK
jgi:phosphatidylserine decarboxylase